MKRQQLSVIFLFFCFNLVWVDEGVGQDVTVGTSGIKGEFSYTVDTLTRGTAWPAPLFSDPYQQVFWIFGDGNFLRDPIKHISGETINYAHPYFAPGTSPSFTIDVLTIDRKTDTPPPSRLATSFLPTQIFEVPPSQPLPGDKDAVHNPYGNNLISYTGSKGSSKRVGITNSHLFTPDPGPGLSYYFIEDNSETVFVLAFSPDATGSIFLFYQDETDDASGFVQEFKDKVSVIPTRYGSTTLPVNVNYYNAADFDQSGAGPGIYNKVIEFKITNDMLAIDDTGSSHESVREELRLFYVFSTNLIDHTKRYQFMVMLGSDDASGGWGDHGKNNFYDDASGPGDSSFVQHYVKEGRIYHKTEEFISWFVDADTISLKGGEPVDPNSLKVTNICKCPDTDEYLVSFELKFCNISNIQSGGANILIQDTADNFHCFQPANEEPFSTLSQTEDGENTGRGEVVCRNIKKCNAQYSCFACNDGQYNNAKLFDTEWNELDMSIVPYDAAYCVGKYLIASASGNTIDVENCAAFRFTARTDSEGLNSLLEDGALLACVEFKEAPCLLVCSYSARLDPTLACMYDPKKQSEKSKALNPPVRVKCDTMLPRNEGDWSIWKNRNSKCEDGCPDCCTTLFCRFNEMLFENKALGATIVLALLVTIAIVVRIILPKIFSKPS